MSGLCWTYDNGAMENLMESIEVIRKFREAEFDKVKAGLAANNVFLKAGIPSPSGYVMNMQPSEAEAGFDVRLPPTTDSDALRRRIKEEWAPAWRNMTSQVHKQNEMNCNNQGLALTGQNSSRANCNFTIHWVYVQELQQN